MINSDEESYGVNWGVLATFTSIMIAFILITIFVLLPLHNDMLDGLQPSGLEAETEILTVFMSSNVLFDSRVCIYEIDGMRKQILNCLYNEGDVITVYQTNTGAWYLKKMKGEK